jgi:hypothetical protein
MTSETFRGPFLVAFARVAVFACVLSAIPYVANADSLGLVPFSNVPSDTFGFAQIDWALTGGTEGIVPELSTVAFDTKADLFTSFSINWNILTFDLLEGGVYQSVNVLPHGPAEFYNALFTGGSWTVQRDSQLLYYFVLQPSYGDAIDTRYVSFPLVPPETTTLAFGTFAVSPVAVPEPSTFALLLVGLLLRMWQNLHPTRSNANGGIRRPPHRATPVISKT